VYVRRVHSRPETIRRLVELGLKAGEMTVEYLQVLLATAEEMLATACTLPEGVSRDDALQMVRAYDFEYRTVNECRRAWAEGEQIDGARKPSPFPGGRSRQAQRTRQISEA